MKTGWLVGILILFIGLQIIMGICEMTYTMELPTVFSPFIAGSFENPASYMMNTLSVLWKVFAFDYPFFTGSWMILRFMFMSVSIGVIIMMLFTIPWQQLVVGTLFGIGGSALMSFLMT